MRRLALVLIQVYRRWISPLKPACCRYTPTCSAYAAEAVARHGVVRGGWLAAWRLARCQPWGGSGSDPVPPARGAPCGCAAAVAADAASVHASPAG